MYATSSMGRILNTPLPDKAYLQFISIKWKPNGARVDRGVASGEGVVSQLRNNNNTAGAIPIRIKMLLMLEDPKDGKDAKAAKVAKDENWAPPPAATLAKKGLFVGFP